MFLGEYRKKYYSSSHDKDHVNPKTVQYEFINYKRDGTTDLTSPVRTSVGSLVPEDTFGLLDNDLPLFN